MTKVIEYNVQTGVRTERDLTAEEVKANTAGHEAAVIYQNKINQFKAKYKKECGNQKIDYVPIFTDQNFDIALSEYIRKRQKVY